MDMETAVSVQRAMGLSQVETGPQRTFPKAVFCFCLFVF